MSQNKVTCTHFQQKQQTRTLTQLLKIRNILCTLTFPPPIYPRGHAYFLARHLFLKHRTECFHTRPSKAYRPPSRRFLGPCKQLCSWSKASKGEKNNNSCDKKGHIGDGFCPAPMVHATAHPNNQPRFLAKWTISTN